MGKGIHWNNEEIKPDKVYWISSLGNCWFTDGQPMTSLVAFELPPSLKAKDFRFQWDELANGRRSSIKTKITTNLTTNLSAGCFIQKGKIVLPYGKPLSITFDGLGIENRQKLPFTKILKFSEFATHKHNGFNQFGFLFAKNSNMPCLHVVHRDKKVVYVIPCSEVIRFYFCTSSKLTDAIFSGGLRDSTIFSDRTTPLDDFKDDGSDYLHLRKGMIKEDLKTIGRMAFYPSALRAARFVNDSVRVKEYPTSWVPFNEKATWTAHAIPMGKVTLDTQFKGYRLFFVTRIINCDYPFLQNGLQFSRDNENSQADPTNAKPTPGGPSNDENDESNPKTNSTNSPGAKVKGGRYELGSQRFLREPDDSKLIKVPKKEQKTKRTDIPFPGDEAEGFSTKIGTDKNSKSGRLNIVPKKVNNPDRLHHDRTEYISEFHVLLNLIKETSREHLLVSNSLLKFDPTTLNGKSFNFASGIMIKRNHWYGNREAILGTVTQQNTGHLFYILDILKRKNCVDVSFNYLVICRPDFNAISEKDFSVLLRFFAEETNNKTFPQNLRNLRFHHFRHQFPTPKRLAVDMVEYAFGSPNNEKLTTPYVPER